jgi:hypothetical protein
MIERTNPRIWLKAFWGFDPENDGYLGFTLESNRDRFLRLYQPNDLILIYGANSENTADEHRRQVLGLLEIEPISITDRQKISEAGYKRKISNGWENRWTYAAPVRRAWIINRKIEVKHIAPYTYTHEMARLIASRGELLESSEANEILKLPVSPVNVFGEPPIEITRASEFTLEKLFSPSRGITPAFGERTQHLNDGEHYLYMLEFVGDISALLGSNGVDWSRSAVVKVGYSSNPARRCDEHNAALPPASTMKWKLTYKSRPFSDGVSAKEAEDRMKMLFANKFKSLGGEFFVGDKSGLHAVFYDSVASVAFRISAPPRSS